VHKPGAMTHVERFRAVMSFQPVDRLPRWEWAMWWDETITRWHGEGLPRKMKFSQVIDIARHFGLDPYQQFWFSTTDPTIEATQHHVEGIVATMDDYLRIRPQLFPDHGRAIESMRPWAAQQRRGDAVVWATFEGFFWFPRTLMGFDKLMLAFYDQPELLHQINRDLLNFNLRLFDQMTRVCVPVFMTIAEDMSYNHGPMISKETFEQFVAPCYRQLIPRLLELNILPFVDTDGDVTLLAPWLNEVSVAGVLPLERQAGVDGMELRERFPTLRMIGHFDKLTMNRGEAAMRAEFERLLPLMRAGGFIPSVDHQTPPGVSLEQYRSYLRLLQEFTAF
jgi:uroporphyrinogen decarboxylase-like protein